MDNPVNFTAVGASSSFDTSPSMIGVFNEELGNTGGGMEAQGYAYNKQQCHAQGQVLQQQPLPSMFPDQSQWDPYFNSVGHFLPPQDPSSTLKSSTLGETHNYLQQQPNTSEYTCPVYTHLDSSCHTSSSNSTRSSVTSQTPLQSPTSPMLPSTSSINVASGGDRTMKTLSGNCLPETLSALGPYIPQKHKTKTLPKVSRVIAKDKSLNIAKITDRKEQNAINAKRNREKKKQEDEEKKRKLEEITAQAEKLKKECDVLSMKEKQCRVTLEAVAKQMGMQVLFVPQQMCPTDTQGFLTRQISQMTIKRPLLNRMNQHHAQTFIKPMNFGENIARGTGISQQQNMQ